MSKEFTIRNPLLDRYILEGKFCEITQLLGERPEVYKRATGHNGIDIRTRPREFYKYDFKANANSDPKDDYFVQVERTDTEKQGRIPFVAVCSGTLRPVLKPNKKRDGWGVWLYSDVLQQENHKEQYRVLYWHIESLWHSLASYARKVVTRLKRERVRRGAIIGITGHNGFSSAPHLHLELWKRIKRKGLWSRWIRLDPLQYFDDEDVIYRYQRSDSHIYYKGMRITHEQMDGLVKTMPPVKTQ